MTIYFVSKTARIVFDKKVAEITCWLMGMYPPLIYYVTKLVPTTILLFLISLAVYLLINCTEKNFLHYLLCGFAIGFAVLCDPAVFVLYPIIIMWSLGTKKITFFRMCLVIVVSIIILIPWTIRNYTIHKRIVPITTQFSINLWIGNNPNATGTDYYKIESMENEAYVLMTQTLTPDIQDSLAQLSEIKRADYFLTRTSEFIRHNPRKFVSLLFKKFYYYWWFAPSHEYSSSDMIKYRMLLVLFYTPMLILGLFGVLFAIKDRKPILLIMAYMISVSALYIATHVGLIRYRMPVEMYLLMFSSYAIRTLRC